MRSPIFNFPIQAASAFILDHKNRVLILKRSNSVKSYRGYWQLPEGKIKHKESPKKALIRELEEELGYKATIATDLGDYSYVQRILFLPIFRITRTVFLASKPSNIRLSEEHTDYAWVHQKALNSYKLLPGMDDIFRELFTKIKQPVK